MPRLLLLAALVCACRTQRPILVASRGEASAPATLFEAVRIFDGSDALTPPSDVLIRSLTSPRRRR